MPIYRFAGCELDPAERRLLYGTPLVASDILWRPAVAA